MVNFPDIKPIPSSAEDESVMITREQTMRISDLGEAEEDPLTFGCTEQLSSCLESNTGPRLVLKLHEQLDPYMFDNPDLMDHTKVNKTEGILKHPNMMLFYHGQHNEQNQAHGKGSQI